MRCPRCGSSGLRNWDELFCMAHGTFYFPERATDLLKYSRADAQQKRLRYKAAEPGQNLIWTAEEKREWNEWQEGDPLPDWAENHGEGPFHCCGKWFKNEAAYRAHRRWGKGH